ncbi:MAG TPA: HD domain-containing phosphohydrolase [Gemmatimonadaceae bacterium]|jgi:putative nucleotidyltransferase with HDIG domain|nr:HD domain-containing phosphohydrolase [Gemmatimonadaceae bacterium]
MSEPSRFLTSFAQALSTMALYADGHPARERAVDRSYELLRKLQETDRRPEFSFLGEETVYRSVGLREMADWEWAGRLANAGVQRLEFAEDVPREEYEDFLEQVLARLTISTIDTSEARQTRRSTIKFGAIGIRGETRAMQEALEAPVETATIGYSMGEEIEAVRWMHDEVTDRGALPLIEAESVVRSLSVAMHGESEMVLPLLELRQFDEYTTTHCLNVSVLTMALAEHLGMGSNDVRTFGVAGLLHDLGKVRIPLEILNKPGKLTDEERTVMQGHTVEGARIIITSDRELDLAAAVAYEHHIMLNGGGYPKRHFERDTHRASKLVHVCDVFDALRTNRPYRSAWETERVLGYLEEKAGSEFDPDIALPFVKLMRGLEGKVVRPAGLEQAAEGPTAVQRSRG